MFQTISSFFTIFINQLKIVYGEILYQTKSDWEWDSKMFQFSLKSFNFNKNFH